MSEKIKDIFECLKKYANLTPDAIDDLYYLEGTIEDLQQKAEQLENIRKEAIEYINNHQLVFRLSSKKQIENWFDEFYKDLLNILNKGDNNVKD